MPKKSGAAPGIREVAKAAGVSVATASRVLSKADYPVAPQTRERVLEAAQALGFVRNAMARSLSRARSESVGVIVPALHAYYAAMIEGIEAAASAHGLTMLLGLTKGGEEQRERLVTEFLERRVDGLLICAGADDHMPLPGPDEMPIPVVLVGQQPNPGYPSVVTDNVAAGAEAARHLWALGYRQFAYLAPDDSWHDFFDRQKGIEQFLQAAGAQNPLTVLKGIYGEADAYARVGEAIAGGLKATALIASTDRHALGAMAALSDAGRRVPEDVAVMGFDDYFTSQFLRPSLTSMHIPADEMGRIGVGRLVDAIAGEGDPGQTVLEAVLVQRGSTTITP